MGNSKLKSRHIVQLGYPKGTLAGLALQIISSKPFRFLDKEDRINLLREVLEKPKAFLEHEHLAVLAEKLVPEEIPDPVRVERGEMFPIPRPFKKWDQAGIDEQAVNQMELALRLPVAATGALMADAHKGIGVPVGSVLATENAVIPFAVGMDIGCRMCLSVFPVGGDRLERYHGQLKDALIENSRFGSDVFPEPWDDPVLDRPEFREIPIVRNLKDRAWRQIGTSGSGNHFVEFGIVSVSEIQPEFPLEPGEYIALLTHSGSRGFGAGIGEWYSQLARQQLKLPREAKHLSWLDLDSEEGREYWIAMNLAGDYASASHHHIHRRMEDALGFETAFRVENHHNFAWKEVLADGREVVIHRKGATPAGKGELGVIPGSMTAPGFIVRGKGKTQSLSSASHGAGRIFSRKRAVNTFTRSYMKKHLREMGVTLIGGSPEEAPFVYKDIHQVMEAQKDLVEVLGTFTPKIVRMEKK